MKITFWGTGNARGIPVFGCDCSYCDEARINPELERKGLCHLLDDLTGTAFVLDAGNFDLPRLIEQHGGVDSIVLSHFHPDHVYGLLQLNWGKGTKIDVYCPPDPKGYADLFETDGLLNFIPLSEYEEFQIGGFILTPFLLPHGILTYGYAIEHKESRLAYLCDCSGIGAKTMDFLKSWQPSAIIIDSNQHPNNPNSSHNTPQQCIDIASELNVSHVWLTHLSCSVSTWIRSNTLPKGVHSAMDMMEMEI